MKGIEQKKAGARLLVACLLFECFIIVSLLFSCFVVRLAWCVIIPSLHKNVMRENVDEKKAIVCVNNRTFHIYPAHNMNVIDKHRKGSMQPFQTNDLHITKRNKLDITFIHIVL